MTKEPPEVAVEAAGESGQRGYLPALAYHWLTPAYDLAVSVTLRERAFKKALIKQANLDVHQKVLDLGCGTGTLAIMVKDAFPEIKVTGLDADARMLSLARGKAHLQDHDIQFDEGLATELPYPDAHFDRVLSSLFFHHLKPGDKPKVLKEVLRVLKPGGELHAVDWGVQETLLQRAAFLSIRFLDGFDYTDDSVKGRLPKLLHLAGFQHVEIPRIFETPLGTLALYKAVRPK